MGPVVCPLQLGFPLANRGKWPHVVWDPLRIGGNRGQVELLATCSCGGSVPIPAAAMVDHVGVDSLLQACCGPIPVSAGIRRLGRGHDVAWGGDFSS